MKSYAVPLLLQLSLRTLVSADVPTFTQQDPAVYVGDPGDPASLGASDINIAQGDDGLSVTFGTDLTSQIFNTVQTSCQNPADSQCLADVQSVIGVGPTNDGLQKRIIISPFAGIAGAGAAFASLLSGLIPWALRGYDEDKYHVVTLKIPSDQVNEVIAWNLTETQPSYNYQPIDAPAITLTLDGQQPAAPPENVPYTEKAANGDVTLFLPNGLDADIKNAWTDVICSRDSKRSLQKRLSTRCIGQFMQAIQRLAQVGAPGVGIYDIDPRDFEAPRTELLINGLTDGEDYDSNLFLPARLTADQRYRLDTVAAWTAYGAEVGNIELQNGQMVFPSAFLAAAPLLPDSQNNCPDDKYKPFCKNCGGNAVADDLVNLLGKCKGFGPDTSSYFTNCECFLDYKLDYGHYNQDDYAASYSYLLSLPDEGPSVDDPPQCNGLDSNHYVGQVGLDGLFPGFCNALRAQGTQDANSGSFLRNYNGGTSDEVDLSIDWAPGETFDMNACEKHMQTISSGCNGNDPNNPLNWKAGGSQMIELDGEAVYRITPKVDRQPYRSATQVNCNGLYGLGPEQKYVDVNKLDPNFFDFCEQLSGQGTLDDNASPFVRTYNSGTPDEVDLSVEWTPGTGKELDIRECQQHLQAISSGCDGNDPANPRNWKAGGNQLVVAGVPATYRITPKMWRPLVLLCSEITQKGVACTASP